MLQGKVKIIERKLLPDERGWFLKVLTGFEESLPMHTGEGYITMALPGEWRANHYHFKTAEWFTVFKGKARLILEDIETKERAEIIVDAVNPKTIFVPPGIAHLFINISHSDELMIMAYAENAYSPKDTCAYNLLDQT